MANMTLVILVDLTIQCCIYCMSSCSEDQTIRVWHAATKVCIQTFRGHSAPVTDVRFDGKVSFAVTSPFGFPL
jgi:WD40 repeat protein